LPCAGLVWTSSVPTDKLPSTCQGSVTFTTLGPRTIKLTGINTHGVSGTASVNINVIDVPIGSGPSVKITSPTDGAAYAPHESSPLSFSAIGTKQPFFSYEWRLEVGGKEFPIKVYPSIGPGFLPTWIPSDYLFTLSGGEVSGFLGIYITDSGMVASDHIQINVNYPAR